MTSENDFDVNARKQDMINKAEEEQRRAKFECKSCGSIISTPINCTPEKCSCGSNKLKLLFIERYTESEYKQALEQFRDKKLLESIHKELSKSHIGDDNLKMTTFLTCVSGLLKNPKRRMSQAITGNSSEGKDNEIKTNLKHMPIDSFIFVTSATEATIQDDIKDKRIIAFSEVNANRENGANKFLIETIKQKTEGGTSAVKKDIRQGMKEARHEVGEQGTVLYGTTEAMMDEEMQTRFIKGTIETDPARIKKVNENTLDTFSDLDKLLNEAKDKDSWIRIGLTYFFNSSEQPEIYIPYAKYLKEQIKGKDLFDHNNPRSQRDIKRALALTCAMTYLFQEQRQKIDYQGQKVLVSEPQDLINVLKISGEFFNQSYSGLDVRLTNILKIMQSGQEWTARDEIQGKIIVSRNTIKEYCQTLADEGLIEGTSGKELNDKEGFKVYDGNKIYYRRCQKGVKKPLIRCEINELKQFLEQKTEKVIDTFSFFDLSNINGDFEGQKGVKNKGVKMGEDMPDTLKKSEIDTFSLTPFKEALKIMSQEHNNFIPKGSILTLPFENIAESLIKLEKSGEIYQPKPDFYSLI